MQRRLLVAKNDQTERTSWTDFVLDYVGERTFYVLLQYVLVALLQLRA